MLPCGTKYLRVLIFAIFAEFFTIGKKKSSEKNLQQNFSPQKFTPQSKLYKDVCKCNVQTLSFVQKENEIRNKTFRDKMMKLQ